MMRQTIDQRKYSRIAPVPRVIPEGPPADPLVINVSQGGACLWLSDPPPALQDVALGFQCDGRDHVLRSRIVWSQQYAATPNQKDLSCPAGWLAGIAFAGANSDIEIIDIPHDILRAGHATVSFLDRNDSLVEQHQDLDSEDETAGAMALNEASISVIKAATRDLVPVFAKHFSDVRLVFTRQRLEISASFRPPAQSTAPQIQRRDHDTSQTSQTPPASVPSSAARPPTEAQTGNLPAANWRRRGLIAIAGVALVSVGAIYSGAFRASHETSTASSSEGTRQRIPGWGQGLNLDEAVLDGWIAIQKSFSLPDTTMRSAILTLQDNQKYPSAHDLHNLANYPIQVARAFSLLAAAQSGTGPTRGIGALKDDLQSRFMAGARFPDEAPGGRYSSLQRELYNNLVALGVVDLLYRRQDDAGVKEILAAIQRREPRDPQKQEIQN